MKIAIASLGGGRIMENEESRRPVLRSCGIARLYDDIHASPCQTAIKRLFLLGLVHVSKRLIVGSSPTGGAEFSSFFPFYLSSFLYRFLSFLYPFLCTSLHSALSGVESGARCAITEGPAQ